jgi:hypothetical protein
LKNHMGLLALGALLSSGCSLEDVDSDAIRTQGMFADILAISPGNASTLVRVQLTVGGDDGTNVTLVGEDQLEATVGEVSRQLRRSGRGRYEERIDGDAANDVTVRLLRGPDDDPATATARLPEPFSMVLESDATQGITRAVPVIVSWSPPAAGGTVHWSVEGDCIWSESGDTPDDGSLSLEPENLRVRGTQVGEECEVELLLERSDTGAVDPILVPGSKFRASQLRGVKFVSTPAPDEAYDVSPDAG